MTTMGPGVAKPGAPPINAPVKALVAVIGTPAVAAIAGSVLWTESPQLLAVLSLSLVYTIVVALGTCYYLQLKAGKMQPGVYFPAISQLGIERPEQLLYQVGMTLVACCMAAGVLRMEDTMLPHYLFGKNATAQADVLEAFATCRKYGLIAAVGVGTQGLFTLELKISPRSLLHWGGTAVFAYGAFNHCDGVMRLLDEVQSPLAQVGAVEMSRSAKHLFLEKFPSLLFVLPILGQVLSATGVGAPADSETAEEDEATSRTVVADTRTYREIIMSLPESARKRMAAYEVRAPDQTKAEQGLCRRAALVRA